MTEIIRLPQFMRDAEVRAGSFNDGANTVDVIWTAGATVRRRNWMDGEFDEELIVSANAVRLDRLNSGAPFLDTHDTWSLRSVIGSVVPGTARIEGGRGVATDPAHPPGRRQGHGAGHPRWRHPQHLGRLQDLWRREAGA
jgi:hypothetical protein